MSSTLVWVTSFHCRTLFCSEAECCDRDFMYQVIFKWTNKRVFGAWCICASFVVYSVSLTAVYIKYETLWVFTVGHLMWYDSSHKQKHNAVFCLGNEVVLLGCQWVVVSKYCNEMYWGYRKLCSVSDFSFSILTGICLTCKLTR